MTSHRKKAYIFLIITAALWGAASPIIKFTLGGIDPLPFLAYRFLIAGFLSISIFSFKLIKGKKFRHFRANFWQVFLYGLLAVPLALGILFFGLDKTTVLDMTLIGVIGPMVVTLGASLFFHDKITSREKVGITIVLAGAILNSLFPLLSKNGSRLTGNILLLLYLLSDAGSVLLSKKIVRKKVKSVNLTNFAFILGVLVFLPLATIDLGINGFINTIVSLPLKYHLGVWYMAVISGNIAYYLYVRAQRSIEVSEATLFNYLQLVFTVPLAIFWLKEDLSFHFLVGAGLIIIGLIIAERKT
ncbi:DMT family transporter [Candidatus Woesebacteria bacterium]|nr:DMT family transporter [Candidatus Woesebacteria bacterium]